jgi:hypothetical protein
MMSEYLFKLDMRVRYVILKPSNMQKLYEDKTELITELLYRDNDNIFEDADEHVTYSLKSQLQNHKDAQRDFELLISMSNVDAEKIHLFKAILDLPIDEDIDNITTEDLLNHFKRDNWVDLIKIYKYFTATELCNNCDALRYDMTEIFEELDKERVNKVARSIAIKKLRRNELYYCGLAKKLSMRDCGIPLEVA